MKTPQKFGLWVATGALLSVTAFAQSDKPDGPPPGPGGGFGGRPRPEPAVIVKDLAARYASLAVYDANKDGQLDSTEQAAVAQAITDGTLKLSAPGRPPGAGPGNFEGGPKRPQAGRPPGDGPGNLEGGPKQPQRGGPPGDGPKNFEGGPKKPDPAQVAAHMAQFFASIAIYDVNKDGQLDATEQAAVVAALTDGSLTLPHPPGRRGLRP